MANVFSGNPYDAQMAALGAVKPKPKQDPRQAIEGLATQYQVPANVLLALDEVAGGQSEAFAKSISAGVKAGKSVDAVLAEAIGDPARAAALMNRAYDIADEMYPQAAPPPSRGPSVAGDLGRQLGGSIVKGGGAMAEGVGQMVDTVANAAGRAVSPVVESLTGQGVGQTTLGRDAGVAVGDAVRDVGEGIQSGVSPEGRQALMDSTPDGSIFDPANATFGKNPSLRGYAMLASDVLGSLLPVVATAIITKSPGAAAGVGGAMGGGAASETARQIIQDAAKNIGPDGKSQLEKESAAYRELIASGKSPAEALDTVTRHGESLAFALTAPISAFGGGLTGAIATKPIAGLAGRGIAARAAGTAAISGVEEGIQEAAESMATRYGTGRAAQMPIDITEGTFGDFILGALGGAPVGAIAGAANGRREPPPEVAPPANTSSEVLALPAPNSGGTIFGQPPAPPVEPPAPPAPLALPAPNRGGTIIGEGPVGPGPRDPTNFERDPSAPRETLSDGSGQGQAAPPLSSPVPPPGVDGAAAPLGPIASIAATAPDLTPLPEVEPVEVPPMFSEMKPGAQIRMQDPSGAIVDAVFQREEEGAAIVRINGQEVGVDPAAFDQAIQGARRADLEAEAKAKGEKAAKPKAAPKPKPVKLSDQAVAAVTQAAPDAPAITPAQAAKAARTIEDKAASEGWTKGLRKKHENLVTLAGEAYSPKPAGSADVPDRMGSPASDATGQDFDPETGEVSQARAAKGKVDPAFVPSGAVPDGDVDGAGDAGQRGNALTADMPTLPKELEWARKRVGQQTPPPVMGRRNKWFQSLPVETRSKMIEKAGYKGQVVPSADLTKIDSDTADAIIDTAASDLPLATQTDDPLEVSAPPTPSRAPWWDGADDLTRKTILKGSGLSPRLSVGKAFSDLPETARKALTDSFGTLYRDGKIDNIGTIEAPVYALRGETIDAVAVAPTAKEVADAAAEADPNPTEAQKLAGNYQMGHIMWNGLDITIETAKGAMRRGKDSDGEEWSVKMPAHYGYIKRTTGADGDHVDVYVGPEPDSDTVVVIDQIDAETGAFDEHKSMLGFRSRKAALDTYVLGFSDGRGAERNGGHKVMTVAEFKDWLENGDQTKPVRMDTAEKPKPAPARPKAETLQKRPLIHRVRSDIGQIDPDGTFGKDAYARGLNAQTAPGLFKRGAMKDLDNIPAAEHPEIAQIVGVADDGNYLDQGRLLELMLEEIAGRAQPIGEQAILQQEAREKAAADEADQTADLAAEQEAGTGYEPVSAAMAPDWFIPDPEQDMRTSSERDQDIRDAISDVVEAYGITALTPTEIASIVAQLDVAGGSVLAAIEQTFVRGNNDAIQIADKPSAGANPDLSEPPFGPEDEARYVTGAKVGTEPTGEGRSGPATRGAGAGGSGDTETTDGVSSTPAFEPGADGKPQAIMPGMEGGDDQRQSALTARQKADIEARQKQSKMRRLGGNEGDAGPLFGDGPKDLFDAPVATPAPPDAEPATKPKPDAKIEDFGEKIGGARKDVWAGFKDKMEAAQDLDIKVEPLSKSWPEPDYEKLIEAGMDPWTVSFVRAARDMIPRKPGKSWKLRGWAEQVKVLRDFASDILSDKISTERLKEKLAAAPDLDKKISGKIALYDAVGHGQSLKELDFGEHTYSMLGGERFDKPRTFWEVTKEQAATAWSNMPKTLARGDTRDEAIKKFKATFKPSDAADAPTKKAGTKFLIYSQRGAEGAKYKIGVKIGSTYLDLQTGIADVKEARRVVAEESDRLQAKLDQMRTIPNERRDENTPRLGADHRNGADVSPEQFGETFGFRGIEFGNWVEQGRRKQDLNDAYDALMDMASILDIPPKAISLNGSLGLAFGARGAGGKNPAAAHFEPGKVVINLTKRSGRGSLAHEWFHALDNYFARKRAQQRGTYITDNNSPGGPLTDGIRPETVDAFLAVKRAIANTKLKERSSNIDKLRSSPYWGTGIEMHARAFESYVIAKLQDQSASNDYLANIVNGLSWSMQAELSGLGDSYPYLKPEEVETVRPKFDALFAGMERRDTDKGVALEMREFAPDTDGPIADTDISAITKDLNAELARTGLGGKVSVRVVRKLISHVSGNAIAGRFGAADGIEVSAGSSVPQIGVMRHEIIHALRSENLWNRPGGLFTPAEWRGLVKAARAEPEIVASVIQRYKDQPTAMQAEEMVAELYRLWADQRDGYDGVAKALAKVEAFLQAMANMLRGRGFGSAALTMERIASGKVGGRGPDGPGATLAKNAQVQNEAEMRAPAVALGERLGGLTGFKNWRDPKQFVSDALTDAMANGRYSLLGLVPGRPLFTELAKKLPSASKYVDSKQAMDTERNEWHARAATVMDRWSKAHKAMPQEIEKLHDLMFRVTISGIDPRQPDIWEKQNPDIAGARAEVAKKGDRASAKAKAMVKEGDNRAKAYATMKAEFDALPQEAKDIFDAALNELVDLDAASMAALEKAISDNASLALKRAEKEFQKSMAQINDQGLEGQEAADAKDAARGRLEKAKARFAANQTGETMKSLRKDFESARLSGPYFPLYRSGKFFVAARGADGTLISFQMVDSVKKQRAEVAKMQEEHPDAKVSTGLSADRDALREVVDPRFVSDIEMLLADSGASEGLMDAVWQRYLQTMPEQSLRTNAIHRKAIPGYNKDALRAFSSHMFHGAHQTMRLKYAAELETAIMESMDQAAISEDRNRAEAVVQEMARRKEWALAPQNAPWVSWAGGITFLWYLGVSPAAALVNVTQTTVIGPAMMKARFKGASVSRIMAELGKASQDFMRGQGASRGDTWSAENAPGLTDDERDAIREGYKQGTIDKTQAHDLASVAESGVEYNSSREKVMRWTGFFYHHAERFNREVTFLASYRLARAEGMDFKTATDAAKAATWDTHFSYANSDRPRFMQRDFEKVLLGFKQYSTNLIYRMWRDAHQAFHGSTPEDRTEAKTQLIGITLSMFAHAGIKGIWGYGLLMGLAALFLPGDAEDLEEWMERALIKEGDDVGTTAWNFAMGAALNGLPGQASGIALSQRIGSPDLWFRSPSSDVEGEDLGMHYMRELSGPTLGIAINAFRAGSLIGDGEIVRGVEAATPKFLRDIIKTGRFASEGVTTMRGDQIVENVNPWELIVQFNGFSPARLDEAYEDRGYLYLVQDRIETDRRKLHKKAGDAIKDGKPVSQEVMDEIAQFNAKYPFFPVTGDSIKRSYRSRLQANERTVGGANLNPKLDNYLRDLVAPAYR